MTIENCEHIEESEYIQFFNLIFSDKATDQKITKKYNSNYNK